jgi:hypothetical protein
VYIIEKNKQYIMILDLNNKQPIYTNKISMAWEFGNKEKQIAEFLCNKIQGNLIVKSNILF